MELAYKKLLEDNKLSISDLPKDAQIMIKQVEQGMNAVKMAEGRNQTIKPETWDKIKANDKWAVREIMDYLEQKNTNTDTPPASVEEIKEEIKEANPDGDGKEPGEGKETFGDDATGVAIDEEFKAQHAAGKHAFTLAELKSNCPKAYTAIFNGYEEGGQNGIETTNYRLTEEGKETFKLIKL